MMKTTAEGEELHQTETYIPYGGGALWSCESGPKDAAPLLLLSGGPGCCDYLGPVAQLLDQAYRVIRFEQRGCGRSPADGQYDLTTAVEDIERVRRHYGVERWIAGGHSWGANLALVYAMTYPERVQALVYIAGTGIHDNRHWSEEFQRNRSERGERLPEFAYPFNEEVNDEGNRTTWAFGRATDFYWRVSKLNMPALFVIAEDDIRASWPMEQLANLMPNARQVTIRGASHYIWLDNAAKLSAELHNFLREVIQRS